MKSTKNDKWTSKAIYDRIMRLCEQSGWTMNRLADLSGITASTIYSSLYRKSMPTLETLIPICNSLDITLAKFFLIEDEITDELFCVVNELSDSTRKLLLEVAKNMKT